MRKGRSSPPPFVFQRIKSSPTGRIPACRPYQPINQRHRQQTNLATRYVGGRGRVDQPGRVGQDRKGPCRDGRPSDQVGGSLCAAQCFRISRDNRNTPPKKKKKKKKGKLALQTLTRSLGHSHFLLHRPGSRADWFAVCKARGGSGRRGAG